MITNKSIGYAGRLANQIFQHATLISVGMKLGYVVKLPSSNETVCPEGCYDMANRKWISYKLELYDCFDLKSEKSDPQEISELKYTFSQKGFGYDPTVFDIKDSTSLEGYFQSTKFFNEAREEVLKELKFKSAIEKKADDIIKQINNKEIVSIHVRRGDTVIHPTINVMGLDYIGKAMQYFTDKDYNFLIISDDIPWCKENFQSEENVFFSEGNSHYIDLCLLSKCHHNIMSNSTFSLYGAWANPNKNKKVVAPANWFQPHVKLDTKDLYCEGWIVI